MIFEKKNTNSKHFVSSTLAVNDVDKLVPVVTHLLLGRISHATNIIKNAGHSAQPLKNEKEILVSWLSVVNNSAIYQRDGWLFQAIAWAANFEENTSSAFLSQPHPKPSYQGFDSLIATLDEEGKNLEYVVICEDKATSNPRSTIRDSVYPEFKRVENGDRDSEIISCISVILNQTNMTAEEKNRSIEDLYWVKLKRFSVSISIGDTHNSDTGMRNVFEGFEKVIPGDPYRRIGKGFFFKNLRHWMSTFSLKIVNYIHSL